MYFEEISWDGMDWIHVAEDTEQWQTFMNKVINLRVP
jgi:hypothetical protein